MKNTFKWLNITQAIGALNDNAFKMVTVIVLFSQLHRELASTLTLASALLVIPFLLFSNWAGVLADRYSKRSIILATKWAELAILLLAVPALLSGLAWPVLAILFLLAAQSAFFGPVKRGIVPELVDAEELSQANGALTSATYLAIISGLFLPSVAITLLHLSCLTVLCGCIALSVVGLIAAWQLPPTPPANPEAKVALRFAVAAVRTLRSLRTQPWLLRAVYALIAFSGITALFQQALVLYAREIASLEVESSGFLFLLVAVGIALGALIAGRLSRHAIEAGLIPAGAVALALSIIALGLTRSHVWMALFLIISGIGAGMCVVPLSAYVQAEAPPERRGELFGAEGFLSFAAMVVASLLFYLITATLGLNARICMVVTGGMALAAALWALIRLPDHTLRFLLSRLTRLLYRVRVRGIENLPLAGGALLVANHTAYADANIIQAATPRPVRYVMSRDIFKSWGWCRPIFKLTGAIPIHTGDGPRQLAQALNNAREILRQGGVVCIFPEGQLSRTGALEDFRKGFEKIAKGTGCPVIPVHLDNLWGSIFSFRYGEPALRLPRRLPYPVTVRFGTPLPNQATADEVRQAVAELGAETATEQSLRKGNTIAARLLKQARRNWFRPAVRDTLGQQATYGGVLTAACALNRRLNGVLAEGTATGILLPPSVAAVIANAALTLQGRTAVNLNWTVSEKAFQSAVAQSGIRDIITSRRVEAALAIPPTSARLIYLEDLLGGLSRREKLTALLHARFAPLQRLAHGRAPQPSDTACIIFSSGSTGTPKGVMLSHANILANLDGMRSVLGLTPSDSLAGVLPFFHSLGSLVTLWFPLLERIPVTYHANPLQSAQVVRMIREQALTTLLITPTLLQGIMRRAAPDDLKTLRYVLTGGEKLPAALADAFETKFSIRPLQGYGATELSPVVALNIPDRMQGGYLCRGCRAGSVGRALPNIATQVVDPVTGVRLPAGHPGLLLIKGPNVMQGYLHQPEKTAQVIADGWYNTGDIAQIDHEGFIFLTDRLTRFSKIGGEMIPHGALEEVLQAHQKNQEPCIAVVSTQDETRGERLVVCYTEKAGSPELLRKLLMEHGLPNLWIPSLKNFLSIPEIPVLGSGKTDLQSLREYVTANLS